jgi:hypothetical protein
MGQALADQEVQRSGLEALQTSAMDQIGIMAMYLRYASTRVSIACYLFPTPADGAHVDRVDVDITTRNRIGASIRPYKEGRLNRCFSLPARTAGCLKSRCETGSVALNTSLRSAHTQ